MTWLQSWVEIISEDKSWILPVPKSGNTVAAFTLCKYCREYKRQASCSHGDTQFFSILSSWKGKNGLKCEMQHEHCIENCAKITQILVINHQSLIAPSFYFKRGYWMSENL